MFLFSVASVLGSIGCLASLLLLAMAIDSNRREALACMDQRNFSFCAVSKMALLHD